MVHELAAYERAPEQCRLTDRQLHQALFGGVGGGGGDAARAADDRALGADAPALFGHVAEVPGDGQPAGFALWFRNFSTWEGTFGIYLEDLYVRPTARRSGAGTALLAALAAVCARHGYRRLEWSVLDWNSPALAFYRRLGARAMTGWTGYRLSGEPLRALAGLADGWLPDHARSPYAGAEDSTADVPAGLAVGRSGRHPSPPDQREVSS